LNRIADALTAGTIPKLDSAGRQVYANGVPVHLGVNDVHVRFVGLYDTISTFAGVASYDQDKRVSIPTSITIQKIVHAVALSEHREKYDWHNLAQPGVQNLLQEGFIGAHADIGGNYGTDGLSNVTLHWMMYWAEQTGWNFTSNYPTLVDTYDWTQMHYSQTGANLVQGLGFAVNDPIYRDFPSTLQVWEPDPINHSPAGAPGIYFNYLDLKKWDVTPEMIIDQAPPSPESPIETDPWMITYNDLD
jgi:hypothetical protein